MAILFVLNVVLMLVIGKIWPRKEDYLQEYTKQVDIQPYRHVKAVGLGIVILVVGIYIYFAN